MAQGKFNDFGWHSEWHTERKREYSEICIYMSDNRECQNHDSYHYLSKCFDSSHCKLKERKVVESRTRKKKVVEKSEPQLDAPKSYVQRRYEETLRYREFVTIQDSVVIASVDSSQVLELFYNEKEPSNKLLLHQACLEKKVNDIVRIDKRTYRITRINKGKKSEVDLIELFKEKEWQSEARKAAENKRNKATETRRKTAIKAAETKRAEERKKRKEEKKRLELLQSQNPELFQLEEQKRLARQKLILAEQARLLEKRKCAREEKAKQIDCTQSQKRAEKIWRMEERRIAAEKKRTLTSEDRRRKKELCLQYKEMRARKYEEIKTDIYLAKQRFKEDSHALDPWLEQLEQAERAYQQIVSNGESEDVQTEARREIKFWKNIVKYISKSKSLSEAPEQEDLKQGENQCQKT